MNKLSSYLFIITITVLFSSASSSATLDDIRKSSETAKSNISTSHVIYFLDRKHPGMALDRSPVLDEANHKVAELNRNMIFEVDAIIDSSLEKSKLIFTDLRDTNALRIQYNLPKRTRISFPANYIVLVKSNYEMDYYPPLDYEEPNNAMIVLNKYSGPASYYLDLPYLGIIDSNLLDEKYNPIVTEISQKGQKLIQINISYKSRLGTIQCDPQMQYRFRSIVWTDPNGEKKSEITADDYKDINGIPYPFSYVSRQFVNGELDREEIYNFQNVQFNVTLNDLDFKIWVPKGTAFTDLAISNRSPIIGLERFMGIDDALTMGRNMAQNQ